MEVTLTRLSNSRNTREKMEIRGGRREQIKKTVSLFLASWIFQVLLPSGESQGVWFMFYVLFCQRKSVLCVCVCVCVWWESSCQSLNPSNHKANGSSRLAGLRERLICATNFADWHRPVYSDLFCWRSSTGNRFSVFHIQAADGKLIFSISQSDSRDHETFKFYGNMNNFLCDGIKLECLFTDVCSEALTH